MTVPEPGAMLFDRFRVIRPLFTERGGALCSAMDLALGRRVTIRVLGPIKTAKARERMRREMDVLARLEHESAPKIYDIVYADDADQVVLVFEPLDASGLPAKTRFSTAVGIAKSLLGVLAEAHGLGIVHRSVTHDCVSLKRMDEERGIPKLLGWSRMSALGDVSTLSDANNETGIRGEWAPEVLLSDIVDGRTDVYGVATVLFRLLTGRPILEIASGATLPDVLRIMLRAERATDDAPPEVRSWLDRALAIEPKRRFASADEARRALELATEEKRLTPFIGTLLPRTPGSLAGRYDVHLELGRGAMGRVLLAHDRTLDRHVAIKMLDDVDERSSERFLAEARGLGAVHHPSVVQVYDFGRADGVPYLVMEFVSGHDLEEELARKPEGLSKARVASLAHALADGLHAIHAKGLVHGDVKPSNILMRTGGDRQKVDAPPILVDFGLVRAAVELSESIPVEGSPAYMAPERILAEVDPALAPRVDQYALAAVLFEMLTGRLPFPTGEVVQTLTMHCSAPRPSACAFRHDLADAVDEVLARGMAIGPAARFEDLPTFAEALERALALRAVTDATLLVVGADPHLRSAIVREITAELNPRALHEVASRAFSKVVQRMAPDVVVWVDGEPPNTPIPILVLDEDGERLPAKPLRRFASRRRIAKAVVGMLRDRPTDPP